LKLVDHLRLEEEVSQLRDIGTKRHGRPE
jgi:hypothetical protein